jgi:hypothetical protein
MQDSAFRFEREKVKNEAREIYNKIGRVWSPTLNDHVSFESTGFRHLMWKGGERRPYTQQVRRLSLIVSATEIISNPKSRVIKREEARYSPIKRDGVEVVIKKQVRFWAFHAKIESKKIRVIVRQINNGNKHFFSVFEEEK